MGHGDIGTRHVPMGEMDTVLRLGDLQIRIDIVQVLDALEGDIGNLHGINIFVLDIGISGGEDTFRAVRPEVRMGIVDSGTAAEDQNAGKGRTKIHPRPCATPMIHGRGPGGKNSLAR